jgi:hypothetical protein
VYLLKDNYCFFYLARIKFVLSWNNKKRDEVSKKKTLPKETIIKMVDEQRKNQRLYKHYIILTSSPAK